MLSAVCRSTVVALALITTGAGCAPVARHAGPPLSDEYRGRYYWGFEVGYFAPCGGTGGQGSWSVRLSEAASQQPNVRWPKSDRYGSGRAYVRWRGQLSGLGRYGHMGLHQRELVVTEILEARPARDDDCQDAGST